MPTAAEYEYVARGTGKDLQFPWGNEWASNKAVWGRNSSKSVAEVGSLRDDNESHSYHSDLAGNVWEWTSTQRAERMLLKGGSWAETNPANLRAAAAASAKRTDSSDDFGFRCATSTESW